ncbi:uncharacterized protein LOC108742207 isoform X3 [Agrilus planipennis]|uniref:Uncharacterized protein LOC108742207 isoform X3 n=1 Tax=Agrilus planipennis TaxID=224129 RepID=A0A7F5R5H6_AGRPL|nr:uncharacterized protein LOC108742207 isoform X3 [Agrilus planipennis]
MIEETNIKQELKKSPVLWQRLSNGIAIRDLQEEQFPVALHFLKEHYVPCDDFLAKIEVSRNPASVTSFLERILYHLENNSSLIATHEVTGEIAGIIILRTIPKTDFARSFSRPSIFADDVFKRYAIVKSELLRKVDIYEHFGCQIFLKLYFLCVAPNYRQKGLGSDLILSALDVAKSKNIPMFLGTVTDYKILNLLRKLGFQILYEIDYSDFQDDEGKYLIKYLEDTNYTMSIMFAVVPPFPKKPLPKKEEPPAKGKGKGKGKDKGKKKK